MKLLESGVARIMVKFTYNLDAPLESRINGVVTGYDKEEQGFIVDGFTWRPKYATAVDVNGRRLVAADFNL